MLQKGMIYWAAGFGAVAAVGAGGAVWRFHDRAPSRVEAASPAPSSAAVLVARPRDSDKPPENAGAPPARQSAEAAAPDAAPRPRFDIVRIEPTGEAVIAGRAAPRAKVGLTDGGRVVAEAAADEAGEFVIVPPAFAPGGHALALTAQVGAGAALGSPGIVGVDVPAPVARIVPVSAPPGGGPASAAGAAPRTAPALAVARTEASEVVSAPRTVITGVAADRAGRMAVTGAASPGALVRLYLNGAALAAVTAGADGLWSLTIERGMKAGPYAIRADEVDRASAAVVSRAEVPFNYPELPAEPSAPAPAGPAAIGASPAPSDAAGVAAAPAVGGAHAVVRLVDTRKVVAGDSLWGISERLYGDGLRYSQIYAANAAQIRNPRLIYPGQVFVLPQPF